MQIIVEVEKTWVTKQQKNIENTLFILGRHSLKASLLNIRIKNPE